MELAEHIGTFGLLFSRSGTIPNPLNANAASWAAMAYLVFSFIFLEIRLQKINLPIPTELLTPGTTKPGAAKAALFEKLLPNAACYARIGGIAHIMAYAPPDAQVLLLQTLRESRNHYALQILGYVAHDQTMLNKDATMLNMLYMFSPDAKKSLLRTLEENEPSVPQSLGHFHDSGDDYAEWLHMLAILKRERSNQTYPEVAFSHLNDPRTDPRMIMGYLSSAYGKALIQGIGRRSPFQSALERIELFAKQLPQGERYHAMVAEVQESLAAVQSS